MKYFVILFLAISQIGFAQEQDDYVWWNNRHNWDGQTSWSRYITMEPGAMGPNALPVPELRNGQLNAQFTLLVAPEVHFAPGDFTADLFMKINIPIKNLAALQIWWVPVEYFETDTIVRDFRKARTKSAQGFAVGDVYIGTLIPLIQNLDNFPDVLLGINLKTASGNRLQDARYTDTPGYFFDLSFGKQIYKHEDWSIRLYGMGGFFVYQTNRDDYFQNDAFMWGGGTDINFKQWTLIARITGYMCF